MVYRLVPDFSSWWTEDFSLEVSLGSPCEDERVFDLDVPASGGGKAAVERFLPNKRLLGSWGPEGGGRMQEVALPISATERKTSKLLPNFKFKVSTGYM